MTAPIPNSYWVEPHLVAAGEYPDPWTFPTLLNVGVKNFINLTESKEGLWHYSHSSSPNHPTIVSVHYFPIPDHNPPTVPVMRDILALIETVKLRGPTYIHCAGGIGRTGVIVGCYLVERGMTGDDALAQTQAWWKTMHKYPQYADRESPCTAKQKEFVRGWSRMTRP